jgi:hypothetical protein
MSATSVLSGSQGSNTLPTGTSPALKTTNQPVVKFYVSAQLASLTSIVFHLALVVWAQDQLKTFAEMFRKQVYTVDVEPGVVQEATGIVQMQGRKVRMGSPDSRR